MKTATLGQRRVWWGTLTAALLLVGGAAHGDEIADLRKSVEEMQQTITDLKARLAAVEKARAAVPPAATPAPASAAAAALATPATAVNTSATTDAKQMPPSGPNPKYPGYVPLPYTPFIVRFNFKPRVDMTVDNQNPGDKYRFVPDKFPLKGTTAHGGSEEFNVNANGTQIDLDVRAPDDPGNLRLHYQNDFFGSDTSDMKYRLRHAYFDYYNLTAGFTYGVFEDPDGWPDTLDYEGNNAVIFARRALIHYRVPISEHWLLTLGVEKPGIAVDDNFDSSIATHSRAPDTGFNLRWEKSDAGHLQISALFRDIGAKGDDVGTQYVFGWGVNASAGINLTKRDLLQAWVVYGEGLGGLGNDSGFENTDAAYDDAGRLHALRYFSALGGYTHNWNDDWRSTLSYGYVNVANVSGQALDAYHITQYGSANLVYRVSQQLSIGVEGLWGRREVRDGDTGEDFRLQLSFLYSMF